MSFKKMFVESEYKKPEMRDLKDWAKQVWMLSNINDKKAIAIDMVDNFAFKTKAAAFKLMIQKANNGNKIDKLVGDIVLAGEGLKRI